MLKFIPVITTLASLMLILASALTVFHPKNKAACQGCCLMNIHVGTLHLANRLSVVVCH